MAALPGAAGASSAPLAEIEVTIRPMSGEPFEMAASPSQPVVGLLWEAAMQGGVGFNSAVLSIGGKALPVKDEAEAWYDLEACGVEDGAVLTLADGEAHNRVELREVVEAMERRQVEMEVVLDQDIAQVASRGPARKRPKHTTE